MHDNPYRPPLSMSAPNSRGVGWWFLSLVAGAAIGFTFAAMALPV
ncbi:MAG TPA: hypothetical protein VG826_15005 [Pirellulales bacterium]|nr:hypothetical protein [Pirellulales bacterium]